MNFQNLNFDYVEPPRTNPQLYNFPRTPSNHSQVTVLPISPRAGDPRSGPPDHASSRAASPSPRPTIIPYAPTPPSNSSSEPEIYGPDRIFGPPLVPQEYAPRLKDSQAPANPQDRFPLYTFNAVLSMAQEALQPDFKDYLAQRAGSVTPGYDDTPHIQYALDALTRPDPRYSSFPQTSSDDSSTVYRHIPDEGLGYYQPPAQRQRVHLTEPAPVQLREPRDAESDVPQPMAMPRDARMPGLRTPFYPPEPQPQTPEPLPVAPRRLGPLASAWEQRTPLSSASSLVHDTPRFPVMNKRVMSNEWEVFDIEGEINYKTTLETIDGFGKLHFKPRLLRVPSLGALMLLCLLMLAALIFCAAFSQMHRGLVPFEGMYGGLYFVFRVLPQLLAAVIVVYAQCTITAIYRFLPFVHMHSNVRDERHGAIFEDLYPRSFLWPHLVGSWQLRLAIIATWLANLTLPLQSAAFAVLLVDGSWRWAAVQGVVWTLVALYLLLFISIGIMMAYWSRRIETGLMWDARSLADIIAIISSTNVAADYKGTDKLGTRSRIQWTLRRRVFDRLGYWGWRNRRPGLWYTMGITMTDEHYCPRETAGDAEKGAASRDDEHEHEHDPRVSFKVEAMDSEAERDLEASVHAPGVRYRYLPWCLRNSQMLYFVVTALVLFVALLVVSFLPSTRVVDGFLPLLPAGPDREGFSPANFLYSFLPSLLGLVLFLLFRSLDQAVRILQPWAALSDRKGASVQASLLADYAACLPLESGLHAARNGHWRVAIVSTLSALFVLLPALAGGVFMAMTTPAGAVRMFPNEPLFAAVLALLLLYLVGLAVLLPARRPLRLPHAVTCLAEIISFLAHDELLADPAFKSVRSRLELLAKLGAGRDAREQPRWVFGVATAGGGRGESLGVRRMRRFTEKRMAQRTARRLGGSRRAGRRASDLVVPQQ